MPLNGWDYRQRPYGTGARPDTGGPVDRRDSGLAIYLSILPFFGMEILAEKFIDVLPTGIIFPVGFLLFWSFYYTFYRLSVLEDRLRDPFRWNIGPMLSTLGGFLIWFVRGTFIELARLVTLGRWAPGPKPRAASREPRRENTGSYRADSGASPGIAPAAAAPPPLALPPDVMKALALLGLPAERMPWKNVQRRYRELAKKFHPDLNPEITAAGRRFMAVDAAYRRLLAVRGRYF